MSLIIKNPRVYAFYEKHPNFDFEKMNELLVDLLENFQESVSGEKDNEQKYSDGRLSDWRSSNDGL